VREKQGKLSRSKGGSRKGGFRQARLERSVDTVASVGLMSWGQFSLVTGKIGILDARFLLEFCPHTLA